MKNMKYLQPKKSAKKPIAQLKHRVIERILRYVQPIYFQLIDFQWQEQRAAENTLISY